MRGKPSSKNQPGGKLDQKLLTAVKSFVDSVENILMPPNYTLEIKPGRKFIKIIMKTHPDNASGSAWAFIDQEGNILKPASWGAPANGIRGNIYQDNSWQQVDWTGPRYFVPGRPAMTGKEFRSENT